MNDYLWDKSGPADAEVQKLERLLEVYRHQRLFVFPATKERQRRWFSPTWWKVAIAAAAAVAIVMVGLTVSGAGRAVEWQAKRRAGQPLINAAKIAGREMVAVGSVITTESRSSVDLKAAGHGRIRVLPDSTVRLIETGSRHQRLELEHGTIEASLYAPPFMFSVDTPSGTAYDIGCAFRLSIGDDRRGTLEVLSGWVQFEVGDKQELAPAGTQVAIEPGFGPGTAVYEDASPAFREAVRKLDFGGANERGAALDEALAQARPADVYTLLQLMRAATPKERGRIFDRARALKPPPSWVTREGVVRREETMLDAWHASLGLGDAKRWWVHWKDRF